MTLGVIGGLGPLATACYLEMMINMTDASCDQEHVNMIIYNCPQIPDRTAYILGKSDKDPLPVMTRIGNALAGDGADVIAIPCVTAHYFYDKLSAAIPRPIIHAIREAGNELVAAGIKRAGIMATDGTITSGIYQRVLEEMGMEVVLPEEQYQGYVMDVIYKNVKAGLPVDMEKFNTAAEHLRSRGAQASILGCTELSLVKRDYDIGAGFLDTLQVLAKQSVLRCEGKLRSEYDCLIS
ncbi:MAG: amino acid racemase [Clostridiales bacterium]|nr:amino acid racemase [Clostridiales bacterium]